MWSPARPTSSLLIWSATPIRIQRRCKECARFAGVFANCAAVHPSPKLVLLEDPLAESGDRRRRASLDLVLSPAATVRAIAGLALLVEGGSHRWGRRCRPTSTLASSGDASG